MTKFKNKKFSIYLDENSLMLMEELQKENESVSAFVQRMITLAAYTSGYEVVEVKKHVRGPDDD